tara:strand:+ start:1176 stop:1529 length:354 start_codon:yes stop_codon:yes gene_type:complete
MKHDMKLLQKPFDLIQSGKKTIEIRLFDEKRQLLHTGDSITFSKLPDLQETVKVEIVDLLKYNSFRDLVSDYGMEYYSYPKDYPIKEFLKSVYAIYSEEQEKKYGVVGIKVRLMNKS